MIENGIHFILVPDANARRLVLTNLVGQRGSTIGVMVGTWLELISQVSNDYCLNLEKDSWQEDLQIAMQAMPDAFFTQSFEVDPVESFRIIESTLISLITSVEINADISAINLDGIESARTRKIVADLIQLLEKVSRLPSELSVMRQVCTQSNNPLRGIQVYHHDAYPWLNLWQSSFIEALNADSGNAADTAYQEILEASVDSISCNAQSTLGHLQQNLFHKANKVALDESVQWLRVRDYLQEVETTAGMIQSMCDRDESLSYVDFALVVPHADEYIHAVKTVFEQAAIPVSGLPKVTYYRDHGVEAVLNYLICQQKPAPVMAMAAFLISPLMPWAKETGIELSDELMGGKYDIELSPGTALAERQALSLIQENNETVPALNKSLLLFKEIVSAHANTSKFHVDRAVDSINLVLAVLSHESNINWVKLKQSVKPEQLREELAGETMQEGVAVSLDSREPWEKCKHLIVLGFSKRRYPTQAGTSAIFSEDDVASLALCGSTLVSRKKQNELHRDRFIRQVRCARESCTYFLSHLNADASSNHPSESLVYMHNLLDGPAEAEDLILNLDSETDRRLARDLKIGAGKQKPFSWSPRLDDVNFNTDLLTLSEDNKVRGLSPSRLGDLMVSPLAWFLSWVGIELKEWSPEEPGPILLGSLAHGVYENLFKPGKPIPAAVAIKANVPDLLDQELKRIAPFMLAQKWAIERHKLADDITRSAVDWGHALERLGATIVDNEIWLKGEYSGIPIHGQADCILKLPNAQLAVVDYKKAGIANREKPMSKGYDCQVSLYREMLSNGLPEPHQLLDVHHVEVLYYMMNSQNVVAENFLPGSEDVPGWVTIENDVSVNAMALIKQRVDQIRRGEIILNNASDERFYDREAGLKPYALDRSPLVRLFMKPDEEDSP